MDLAVRRSFENQVTPTLEDIARRASSDQDWERLYKEYRASLDDPANPLRPIGLPHNGSTFKDGSIEAFRQRLVDLRAIGYQFPDHVLATVDEEIAEAVSV